MKILIVGANGLMGQAALKGLAHHVGFGSHGGKVFGECR